MIEHIKSLFKESIQTKVAALDLLPEHIEKSTAVIVDALMNGNKVLTCGNGGSAGDAQLFASLLMNRYERERPSLPAISLTTDTSLISAVANDYKYKDIFSKQIKALGQPGDVLFVISTDGNHKNIVQAVEAALAKDMIIIALTGDDGGEIAGFCGPNDVEIRVPSKKADRIHEVHVLVINNICECIDETLFPQHIG